MNGFDIIVKDNFLEKNHLNKIHKDLSTLIWTGDDHNLYNDDDSKKTSHVWFTAPVSDFIQNIVHRKCETILNKKLKLRFCSYTLLASVEPLPHCDLSDECDFQIIIYIKGNTNLHKGTGFYLNNELNTHIGFNENRAIIWHANTWHTPMNWSADDKSKRYSIICQLKELR